jgi:hypothetical protein
MSCFVVSDFDIDILVTAYAGLNRPGAKLLNLTRVGRELLLENIASFEACYRVHERPKGHEMRSTMAAALAQARAYRFTRRRARPAAIAKLAQCYDYQACEHEAWAASPARAIALALQARFPDTLPGFDDMPWGVSDVADLARVAPFRARAAQP